MEERGEALSFFGVGVECGSNVYGVFRVGWKKSWVFLVVWVDIYVSV